MSSSALSVLNPQRVVCCNISSFLELLEAVLSQR